MATIISINRIWLSLSGWVLGLMYIPQIIKLYKEKDYRLVDVKSTMPLTFAILGFTFNGLVIWKMTGESGTFVSQIKSLVPIVIMHLMYLYYKWQSRKTFGDKPEEFKDWSTKDFSDYMHNKKLWSHSNHPFVNKIYEERNKKLREKYDMEDDNLSYEELSIMLKYDK